MSDEETEHCGRGSIGYNIAGAAILAGVSVFCFLADNIAPVKEFADKHGISKNIEIVVGAVAAAGAVFCGVNAFTLWRNDRNALGMLFDMCRVDVLKIS